MTPNDEVLKLLRQLSKISLLANARPIEAELSRLANTDERKKMWVLIDGRRMAKDIAKDARVSERAVNYFLATAQAADLIKYERREPPIRLLDYSPPEWIELTLVKEQTSPTEPNAGAAQSTLEDLSKANVTSDSGVDKNG